MDAKNLVVISLFSIFLMSCASSSPSLNSQPTDSIANEHRPGFEDKPYFRRGSDVLDATAREAVAEAAMLILKYKTKIKIVGHTDNCDDEASNLKLSQSRAKVVEDMLLALGVSNDRIVSVAGIGSSQKRFGVEPCSLAYNDRVDIDVVF